MRIKFTQKTFSTALIVILFLPWFMDIWSINMAMIPLPGVLLLLYSFSAVPYILDEFGVSSLQFIFFTLGCFFVLWSAFILWLINKIFISKNPKILAKLNRYLLLINTVITICIAVYAIIYRVFLVLSLGYWLYLVLLLIAVKNVNNLSKEILDAS